MRSCAHECVCWAMVEYGDDECPGRCDAYAPMVDVDALTKLADRMEHMAGVGALLTAHGLATSAASIREALGVES